MKKRFYTSESKFEKDWGYSRAIRVGDTVYLSATGGWNYETMEISRDPAEQMRQTFQNVEQALQAVGAELSDLVQMHVMYASAEVWREVIPIITEKINVSKTTLAAFQFQAVPDDRVLVEFISTAVVT